MAYSAALGETDPRFYDTAAGALAHPLFPVCYEWPAAQPLRQVAALRDLYPRLIHAEHDLRLHRLPRDGDRLRTRASIRALEQRKPGAFVVFRFETTDAQGGPVSSTDFGVLYRGIRIEGPDRAPGGGLSLPPPADPLARIGELSIAANAAHVYTECARVWNPIHTDIAYARAAGLPGLILHGSATLALTVSRVLAAFAIDPARVRRVQCRFSGMVSMPSTLTVHGARTGSEARFETREASGSPVITRGALALT